MEPTNNSGGWWLLRDGEVVAAAEVAETYGARAKGLLGRRGYEGALVFPHTNSVHTLAMRFPIDVGFLDREMVVVATVCMRPWRLGMPRLKARWVIEAEAGAFERWRLATGDRLELREVE